MHVRWHRTALFPPFRPHESLIIGQYTGHISVRRAFFIAKALLHVLTYDTALLAEARMKRFIASVDYASKLADGTRHFAQPFFFMAANELEAGNIVRAIAEFAAQAIAPDVHVQYAESGYPARELPTQRSH